MSEKEIFKLEPEPSFWASVEIPVPGGVKTIHVRFKYRNIDEFAAFLQEIKDMEDIDALMLMIEEWQGPDAAFSRETLQRLLRNYPRATRPLYKTYRSELLGAAEKN